MPAKIFDLSDRVIVVTGGYGYIGKQLCIGLLRGKATVVLTGRNEEKCIKVVNELHEMNENFSIYYEVMDVSSEEDIQKAASNIHEKYGKIYGLVNNAYYGAAGKLDTFNEEDWDRGIDGTINSVFRCTKLFLPHFTSKAVIINIASMYGLVSPQPMVYEDTGFDNPANYGAGKAAIIQFNRYCAVHLAKRGIRVNCISPGPFPNPQVLKEKKFIENLTKRIPLERMGNPEELQGIILFLASDASSYVTGQNINVDGGWTIW